MTQAFVERHDAAVRNAVTQPSHYGPAPERVVSAHLRTANRGFKLVRTGLRRNAAWIFGLESPHGLRA